MMRRSIACGTMARIWIALLALGVVGGLMASQAFASLKTVSSIKYAHMGHPKWSPNGVKLAYEVRKVKKSVIEIHIRNFSTNKTQKVRPSALQSGGFNLSGGTSKRGQVARELSWSPNSAKYLFSSNGTGTVFNIYLSQEGVLKINSRTKSDGHPSWSKNGKYIAFTSGRTGSGDLYYARMVGSNLKARRLTKTSSTELFPVWSPTRALTLAYLRHTDQQDRIYLIKNIFTRKSVRLTKWSTNISELNPSWSPDGKKIAFYGARPGANKRYDLFVVSATPGSRPTRLDANVIKSDQYGPAWSPDGKHLIYAKKISRNRDKIRAVNVSTKSKKWISTGTSLNNEISVAKRGGKWHIAFTAQGRIGGSNNVYRKLYVKTVSPF